MVSLQRDCDCDSMLDSNEHSSINWQQVVATFAPGSDINNRSQSLYTLSKYISKTRHEQSDAENGTETLIALIAPVLESRLAETDEATLIPTLYFFAALFQLDMTSASRIFCRDGVLSSVMDTSDILPSSKAALHAIAELLSQATSEKQCRSLISSDEIRTWLERNSQQSNDPSLRATASLTLVKLYRGLEEDSQSTQIPEQTSLPLDYNVKTEQLFESLKDFITTSFAASPSSSAILDSIEGLAYLTVQPNFKERLAEEGSLLKNIMGLARGQAKPSFPASYQQVSPAKTALEYDFGMCYGISAIILNLCSYKRRLSEEEKQVERLRTMTKPPNNNSSTEKNTVAHADHLEDDHHVRIRCTKLLQAGAAEALSTIVQRVSVQGPGRRNIIIHRTVASALLHLSENKDNRGKILQGGGVKTLLSIIQASLGELPDARLLDSKKVDLLDVGDLQAIQALAKLAITSPPNIVFGPNPDGYIDAIRPFAILLIHSSSSLLQKFEVMMALTNLASVSPDAAERLATFRLQGASKDDQQQSSTGIIVQRCEHLLLDNNFMVRRAAMEMICNLVGGSEAAFDYFGGTAERSSKSKLHILVALSDVEDLPTRSAASGALAVLTASPHACRSLAELELEQHRVIPIMVGLISPSIAAEYLKEGEGEQHQSINEVEDIGLVHRGVVCIRNMFDNLNSREERVTMSLEGEKKGLVRALVHVVKNTPGGPNNATIIKPAAEVLKWIIEAGVKLPL